MNHDDYFETLEGYMTGLLPGGLPPEVLPYFKGHRDRFELSLDMFDEHLIGEEVGSVLDVGTGFPFVSYYFKLTRAAAVVIASMEKPRDLPPGTGSTYVNLNTAQELPPADLVICTECLEHIPRRHDYVLRVLCKAATSFLFLSVPMGGSGAVDHDVSLDISYEKIYEKHLREYSPATIGGLKDHVEGNGFQIVREATTQTNLYRAPIAHLLFRRVSL